MITLEFLMSPYLLELPMQCLGNKENTSPKTKLSSSVLLLDLLSNEVYLVDKDILLSVDWDEKQYYPGDCNLNNRDEYFRKHNYLGIEVEINSHCNHKCCFCPVAYNYRPAQFMSLSEYKHIVSEAIRCNITNISLNHYSEPTLHPNLTEIIDIAANCGLTITLFTNGSKLTPDIVNSICKWSNSLEIVVNIPECDEQKYCRVTKSTHLEQIVTQVNYAKDMLPVKVVVNNSTVDKINGIQELFPDVKIQSWNTDDRAGAIRSDRHQVHNGDILNGCPLATRFVNISVDGDVFLCAQDYHKQYVLGNVRQNSLIEIFEGQIAEQYRRWIFGADSPPSDFICRHCSWTKNKSSVFSVGNVLSHYDLEVYTDIVHSSSINRITANHKGGIVS